MRRRVPKDGSQSATKPYNRSPRVHSDKIKIEAPHAGGIQDVAKPCLRPQPSQAAHPAP